jgi:hypothetical protein
MTPGISNPRAWDYPSLALAARAAAREAGERRQQAAEILDLVDGEHVGTRREASRVLAHAAAQHLDLRRLEHLAALHAKYPILGVAIAALEAGSALLSRVSSMLRRQSTVVGLPVFARRAS